MILTITKSALLAMSAIAAGTSLVSAEPVTRIVGGQKAKPGDYPYFVQMGDCGGALIAPDAILFAAHCEDWKDLQVNIGAYKLSSLEEGAQQRFCDVWVPDPLFGKGGSSINNDFALCKLNKPVTIDSPITLELNEEDAVPASGQDLEVMGLGALSQGGSGPEYLHEVTVPAITNKKCNQSKYYGGEITDAMFCAGFPDDGGKDSCQGDSGGPIVQKIGNKHLHVGVVSWGYGCAQATKPGVYARTSKRADWIKATVCDQFNSVASFCDNSPPPPPPSCGNELNVRVKTDIYAYETEWTLRDSSGNDVMTRKYLINNYQNDHTLCLEDNECYVWNINDFDGIAGGSYSLSLNGKGVASGNGSFSGTKTKNFCTEGGVTNPDTPTPAPVVSTPAPVASTPTPTSETTPAPVASTPAPVASTPTPTSETTPAPTPFSTDDEQCVDDPTFRVNGINRKTCGWVAKRPNRINIQCRKAAVRNACLETCGQCESTGTPSTEFPTQSPTYDFCADDPNFTHRNQEGKTCEWVGQGTNRLVKRKCRRESFGLKVYDWCPATCGEVGLGFCS